jgi:hypothetical protein
LYRFGRHSEAINPYIFCRTFWRGIGTFQGIYLHRERQSRETQRAGISPTGFEPASPEFELSKTALGRPRRRWEDNIKMDLREIGFGDVDWIHWVQDRDRWRTLVNTVMNLRVP